jgi:hypothetical protein
MTDQAADLYLSECELVLIFLRLRDYLFFASFKSTVLYTEVRPGLLPNSLLIIVTFHLQVISAVSNMSVTRSTQGQSSNIQGITAQKSSMFWSKDKLPIFSIYEDQQNIINWYNYYDIL